MNKHLIIFMIFLMTFACSKKEMKYWERINLGEKLTDFHILNITCKGDDILIGTFGKGALFSEDNGQTWHQYKTNDSVDNSGLSWNYIFGGDWDDDYIILATLGDGLNISKDDGNTWQRLGYNFFGVEYLYTVNTVIDDDVKYIATADGIVCFTDDINPDSSYEKKPYSTIDENQGLASQYIYDMLIDGDNIYIGSLHGFSASFDKGMSWSNFSPSGASTDEGLADCKVRAVAVNGKTWYAGCDNGLFYSSDKGQNWVNISRGLPSLYVHDILIDKKGNLWVATYKGAAFTDNNGQSYKAFGKTSGFYGANINCLALAGDGNIYAGTNYGLYRMIDKIPAPNAYPEAQAVFNKLEKPVHQWLRRPVSPEENNMRDQTYLYGATMGGNFRQHQGCEYNNPEGTKLYAVDDGVIVYTNKKIGHLVLKCDTRFEDYYVYVHYHHMDRIMRRIGRVVSQGDIIGTIGKKGNVTNEHLHFEVSLSKVDDSNVPNKTVNNELWQKPLPGCGTIAGNVIDTAGNPVLGARVYGVEKPAPTESPFSYAECYCDSVNSSPAYNENFVIADVPAGEYLLWVEAGVNKYAVKAMVGQGKVTRVKIIVGQGL